MGSLIVMLGRTCRLRTLLSLHHYMSSWESCLIGSRMSGLVLASQATATRRIYARTHGMRYGYPSKGGTTSLKTQLTAHDDSSRSGTIPERGSNPCTKLACPNHRNNNFLSP